MLHRRKTTAYLFLFLSFSHIQILQLILSHLFSIIEGVEGWGDEMGPGFPEGLLSLLLSPANCQSLTSAAGCRLAPAPHGGAWLDARLGVPYGLLFSPLSSALTVLQCREDCSSLLLVIKPLTPLLKPDVCWLCCLLSDMRAEALRAPRWHDRIPSLHVLSASPCVRHPFCTNCPSRSLSLSLPLSLFLLAHRAHTPHAHRSSQIYCKRTTCCSLCVLMMLVRSEATIQGDKDRAENVAGLSASSETQTPLPPFVVLRCCMYTYGCMHLINYVLLINYHSISYEISNCHNTHS